MRDRYDEITHRGADVTAIGTGGRRMAEAFIADEKVPFRVLLDHDGSAATLIGAGRMRLSKALGPRAIGSAARALVTGHSQGKSGPRPMQLGGTLVIGPGNDLRLLDLEEFAGDHTAVDRILEVL